MRVLISACTIALLAACGQQTQEATPTAPAPVEPDTPPGLAQILESKPADVQARFKYRHPQETLEFFGIEPGMTVIEVLPGGGWYTKILLPYLGSEGEVIGVNYAQDIWKLFGYMSEEQLTKLETWATDWPAGAQEWRGEGDARVSAFVFGNVPQKVKGTVDAVLFIRALHNMARFEAQGAYLANALNNAHEALKPGGIVGIVQHKAPEDAPDEWANGSAGYLKESFVIAQMEAAGFQLMGASDVNSNPKDRPTTSDIVWRLPPTLQASRDNEALQAQMLAIGESNRMTLKFRKPE